MSEKRTHSDYLQKAAMYDLLAQFYKYSIPSLHTQYYLKHIKYMNKAMNLMRTYPQSLQEEARIRILHTSHNSPNVDVYINGKRLVKDLPFKNVSDPFSLKAGKYHIDIYPTGNMVDSVLNKKITVEAGKSYTLATIDHVKKMRLLVFQNQPKVPANESKVRFIHLSPDSPAVDIAVKDRDVVFPAISYKQATEYLGLTPMTVDLEVRIAGSKTVVLPMPKLHFKPNQSYTIVLVGLANEKPEFQFIRIKE
ncbi:DUF4397 domain-containing protein [Neobacillus soli]|uniref:DUF4397 domain-containing protein n=1 Tax=Neobacillus soli TaxID=220688 RepID=UPI000824FCC7|nr:DUF4397 domain-containing protein [Neobacillus soli]